MTDEEKKKAEAAAASDEFRVEALPVESPTVTAPADAPPPMLARPPDDAGYSATHAAQVAADASTPSAPPADVPLAQKLVHAQEVLNEAAAKGQISQEQYAATSKSITAQMADATKAEKSASASQTASQETQPAPHNKSDEGPGAWEETKRLGNKIAAWGPAAIATMAGGPAVGAMLAPGVANSVGQSIGFLPKDGAPGPAAHPLDPVHVQPHAESSGTPPPPPQQTVNVPAASIPKVSPGIRGEIIQGEGGQLLGVNEQEQAEAAQAAELADAKERAAEDMRVTQVLDEQDRAKQRQDVDTHLAQIQAKSDAVAAKKIDPQEYLKSLSTGQKILGVIGMALSGALEGFTGRPNSGDTLILKGINDSIESQKANLENERHGIDNDKDLYANKLRLFDDDQKAKAAARQEALAAAVQQIDALAAKYNSPIIQARADQLKGQLLQQFGHDQATLETYVPAHQVTTGGPGSGADGGYMQPTAADFIQYPPGSGKWVAVLKGHGEDVIKQIDAASGVHQAADQMRDVLRDHSRGPSWIVRYDAARETLAKAEQAAGGRGGVGIIGKNEEAIGKRHLFIWTPGVDSALKIIEKNADQNRDAAVAHTAQFDVTPVYVKKKNKEGVLEQEVWYRNNGSYTAPSARPAGQSAMGPSFARAGEAPGSSAPASQAPASRGNSPTEQVAGPPGAIEQGRAPPKSAAGPAAAPKGKGAGKGTVPKAPADSFNLPARH